MESTESTESTEATEARQSLSIEDLKEQGNLAFKRAALLRRTTAASQYLSEAKSYYIEAIQRLGSAKADSANLALTCVLHSNLAAVYLQEVPPKWTEAKAAADIALTVDQQNVKARFRRAQALLQALKEALDDLKAAQTLEPRNSQVRDEAKRVSQRLDRLEQKQQVPIARKIVEKHVAAALLDRGSDCLDSHGYVWGQSNHIVRVFVPVQGSRLATRSQVECKILTNKLQLKLLDAESHVMFEVDACLHKAVRADESSWQMEEGGLLLIVELVKRDTSEDSEHWSRSCNETLLAR
ncbi:unnamed protein product [Effrenium voratum]|nr:unnamed protein product [Effrenium voratum]